MFCTACGFNIANGETNCPQCGKVVANAAPAAPAAPVSSSQGMNFDFSSNSTVATPSKAKYEYKVLSQKDKWFSGKFDPVMLEKAINAYAEQGWRVIGCATADIPGFGTTRQEFVTLLEREV